MRMMKYKCDLCGENLWYERKNMLFRIARRVGCKKCGFWYTVSYSTVCDNFKETGGSKPLVESFYMLKDSRIRMLNEKEALKEKLGKA